MAYNFYGSSTDIGLTKNSGVQGGYYDLSNNDDESKYQTLLNAYKSGSNPVIVGGGAAAGGVSDTVYRRLLDAGANITRIGGANRTETQNNLKTYVNQLSQNNNTKAPTYKAPTAQTPKAVEVQPFNFNYNGLNAETAQNQIKQQLDPIYQRALENIRAQKYQNELNAGQTASARGLAHSGLAADLQNKVAIAAQGQVANTEAERASKTAEMAQALLQQDQARGDALRQQAYQEYMGGLETAFRQNDQQYQQYRDSITDAQNQYQMEYGQYRDSVGDQRYANEQIAQKLAQQDEKQWREYAFNNMSAAEKAQLEWAKSQFGEDQAWKMFELKYNGQLAQSQNQAALNLYTNSGFLTP